MQVPTEFGRPERKWSGTGPAGSFAAPSLHHPVYDLRVKDGGSDGYYDDVARFSVLFMAGVELRASWVLNGYGCHARTRLCEGPRSRGEYALDLLTLGMALRLYERRAAATRQWVVSVALALLRMRRGSAWIKPMADCLRGLLFTFFPAAKSGAASEREAVRSNAGCEGADSLHDLTRLIQWLEATGELEQEAKRIRNWRSYLATVEEWEAARLLEVAGELFSRFESDAAAALGSYTKGVDGFLGGEFAHRGCREDRFFCGRKPVEYHLNMVAAEVMNQGLRKAFERTPRKVVLVPACMRGKRAGACKAQVRGADMTCTACDPECNVNYITRRMRRIGAGVYIVPHTNGFNRWLDRWQREPGVGVVAVACMLNILPGGYEMRARRIASQCVPLDYPGCKKHWDREGFPTAVNEDRLVQIAATPLCT